MNPANLTPKILVIDDEIENLRAIERTLRTEFEVTAVDSPNTALELVSKEKFSVIVSDQRMPGMKGTELLSQIAKASPLTTRVILTAYTDSRDMLEAINRAEIYRFVTKPWDNAELVATIRNAVERNRLLTDNHQLIESLQKKEHELTQLNKDLERLVELRTAELRAVNEKLSEQAMTDPLTRIHNRRAFFMRFNDELEEIQKISPPHFRCHDGRGSF